MAETSFGAPPPERSHDPLSAAAFPSAGTTDRETLVRSELIAAIRSATSNFAALDEIAREQRELIGISLQHESAATAYIRRALSESNHAPSAAVNSVLLGVRRLEGCAAVAAAFDLRCKYQDGSLVLLFDHGEFSALDPSAPGAKDFFVVSPGSALLEVSKVATSPISYERIYLHPFEFSRQLELFVSANPETRTDSLFCGVASRALALRSATLRLTEPFTTELIEKTPTKGVVGVVTNESNFVATFALTPNFTFTASCEAA